MACVHACQPCWCRYTYVLAVVFVAATLHRPGTTFVVPVASETRSQVIVMMQIQITVDADAMRADKQSNVFCFLRATFHNELLALPLGQNILETCETVPPSPVSLLWSNPRRIRSQTRAVTASKQERSPSKTGGRCFCFCPLACCRNYRFLQLLRFLRTRT